MMTKKDIMNELTAALQCNPRDIHRAVRSMHAYADMGEGLAGLNTMRGGTKGFKGFVMEEMEAGSASALGRHTEVINNNGIADLRHVKANGTEILKQMKTGYKPGQIDFNRYMGQTVVIDKGNPNFKALKELGRKAGVKVVEGHVADAEAKTLANLMQLETKLTGSKNAVVTSHLYSGAKSISAAHTAGLSAARSGAFAGAGVSLGSNMVEVMRGNKTAGEAAGDIVIDTATSGAIGYGLGAAGSAFASTAVGAAALETAGAIGTAVSSAPVIGTAITAGAGAIGAAGTAISAGAGAAATAVGLGVAAPLAAAAAPFVIGGAILGGIGSLLFGDD